MKKILSIAGFVFVSLALMSCKPGIKGSGETILMEFDASHVNVDLSRTGYYMPGITVVYHVVFYKDGSGMLGTIAGNYKFTYTGNSTSGSFTSLAPVKVPYSTQVIRGGSYTVSGGTLTVIVDP